MDVRNISVSRPIVLLLAHYPAREINRAFASLTEKKYADIPLSGTPETMLQEVTHSMRELLVVDTLESFPNEALLNGFAPLLRGWCIRVTESEPGRHPKRIFSLLRVKDGEPDEESTYSNSEPGELLFP
jgi:hypothetical protein